MQKNCHKKAQKAQKNLPQACPCEGREDTEFTEKIKKQKSKTIDRITGWTNDLIGHKDTYEELEVK